MAKNQSVPTHYKCDICNNSFTRKRDLTIHTKNCKIIDKVDEPKIDEPEIDKPKIDEPGTDELKINEPKIGDPEIDEPRITNYGNYKQYLITKFKHILNILRNNEGITGEVALRNMGYFLVLKMIEPQIGKNIDFDNYNFNFSNIHKDHIERFRARLLRTVRFSNLVKEPENNLTTFISDLWEHLLSQHPATKNVFPHGKKMDLERQRTCMLLLKYIDTIEFQDKDCDVLGCAYEEVIQDIMACRDLGQFFTPSLVKRLMIDMLKPTLFPDGKIETLCDPAMGTGGFLISYLNNLIEQAKEQNISLDWKYIVEHGIYGKEIHTNAYQLAASNMLISSGHMFNNLERGDSIRTPIKTKFDCVLANPPFGINGLEYDGFNFVDKIKYFPIRSNNAVSLFIQVIVGMLKVGGRCAMILPDGQDLFGKSNGSLIDIREFLLRTCDLTKIVYLPKNIFENTGINTCIFHFIKKKNIDDVMNVNIKYLKSDPNKEHSRSYNYKCEYQTPKVDFYETVVVNKNGIDELEKNLLASVPINKIICNRLSLNYSEYIEGNQVNYSEQIIIKTLGEVCTFGKSSKRLASYGSSIGKYPFYTSSEKKQYCDEADYNEPYIIIGTGGTANVKYDTNFSCSSHNVVIKSDSCCLKYIYYYLLTNLNELEKYFVGVAIKNISKVNIEKIKIPIPSINMQKKIIEFMDLIYEKCIPNFRQSIDNLKLLNYCHLENQKLFGENEIKTLGDICLTIKTGKFNSSDCKKEGNYPFYTNTSTNPSGFCDKYCFDFEKYFILVKDGGAGKNKYGDQIGLGKIFRVSGKSSGTSHQYALVIKNEINYEYAFQCLKFMKNQIMDLAHYTTSLGCIRKNDIVNLKIFIPQPEIQKKIADYCHMNDSMIMQLEEKIEQSKQQSKNFLETTLKKIPNENVEYKYINNPNDTDNIDYTENTNDTDDTNNTDDTESTNYTDDTKDINHTDNIDDTNISINCINITNDANNIDYTNNYTNNIDNDKNNKIDNIEIVGINEPKKELIENTQAVVENKTCNASNPMNNTKKTINNIGIPLNRTTQPLNRTTQPLNRTIQPLNRTSRPLNSATRTINSTFRPINTTNIPLNTTIKPINSIRKPLNRLNKPINNVDKSG